ncbi:MAG: hypothetical protein IPH18_13710 [Chitinophagaceae bacterium]|nr:hypothetical protein [Chitinophagaceae bacterium]
MIPAVPTQVKTGTIMPSNKYIIPLKTREDIPVTRSKSGNDSFLSFTPSSL